jgi:hypothetical protein
MRSTACTNSYPDHNGHTHHVKGTKGGQQGDGLEIMCFSLSQHPIVGRVFARWDLQGSHARVGSSVYYVHQVFGTEENLAGFRCLIL